MRVAELWTHPLKSAQGIRVEEAVVGPLGIVDDRRWALEDLDTGLVLTARRVPDLLWCRPVLRDGAVVGVLRDGGVLLEGDEALSGWLGRPVRLVAAAPGVVATHEIAVDADGSHASAPDADGRGWDGEWVRWEGPDGVFHDSASTRLSLVAAPALEGRPVRRVRPNVVLDAGDERDLVGHVVAVGEVVLEVVGEIPRCVVVTRPQPGIDRDPEVLRRIHRERGGSLGVAALVRTPGRIAVGDEVLRA